MFNILNNLSNVETTCVLHISKPTDVTYMYFQKLSSDSKAFHTLLFIAGTLSRGEMLYFVYKFT